MAEGTPALPTDSNSVKQSGLFDGTNFYHARRDATNLGALTSIARREAQSTATIGAAANTSDAIDLQGYSEAAIALPAAFTGTLLTFTSATTSGGTYKPVYDQDGVQVTLPVAQGNSYYMPREAVIWPFVKIVSNATEGSSRSIAVQKMG